jgi:hypothetical protein
MNPGAGPPPAQIAFFDFFDCMPMAFDAATVNERRVQQIAKFVSIAQGCNGALKLKTCNTYIFCGEHERACGSDGLVASLVPIWRLILRPCTEGGSIDVYPRGTPVRASARKVGAGSGAGMVRVGAGRSKGAGSGHKRACQTVGQAEQTLLASLLLHRPGLHRPGRSPMAIS